MGLTVSGGSRRGYLVRYMHYVSTSCLVIVLYYFLILQNSIAWTNLGVLYLNHNKAAVSYKKNSLW